jgi:Regulator of chromosome condensation (RCC1) repeat
MLWLNVYYSIGTGTAIDVQAGWSHVCIIKEDKSTTAIDNSNGEVLCWGSGSTGQLVRNLL